MPQPTRILFALATSAALLTPVAALAQDAQPAYAQPAYPQPAYPQPAYPQPAYAQPGYAQPSAVYVDAYGHPVGYGYPPPVRERPPVISRVGTTVGVTVGGTFFEDSQFNRTASLWGYSGFRDAIGLSLQAATSLGRFVMLGGRLGYQQATGGTAYYDSATLHMTAVDLGMIARFGVPIRLGLRGVFFPGVQLEAGGANLALSLRESGQNTIVPRGAAQLVLMFASEHFGATIRAGYQWMHLGDLGGDHEDLSLSGFTFAVGLEARL